MVFLLLLPAILSLLALGAHFFRDGMMWATAICLVMIGLLAIRRTIVVRLVQVILILAAAEWVRTLFILKQQRMAEGQAWERMAVILAGVAMVAGVGAAMFETPMLRKWYRKGDESDQD